ncbi:MAG: hypothetical protein OXI67_05365 [Candidatus Poribacteria bacterium]|nr:hypothetical protein [Candidatus Poribacteria bacterium]
MKSFLKGLSIFLFIAIIIGFCFCVYILQAPPVAKPDPPKLQVHTRTALRDRPTVNSKPIVYTKDVYRFSIDQKFISNLNTGLLSNELLFSVPLGQRTLYSAELLDKELKTVFNWQKMFADSEAEIRLSSRAPTTKVLISGKDWFLTDSNGAGFTVQKNGNALDIYLPNLQEAFENNKNTLSADVELSIEKIGKQWLIKDNQSLQVYEIRNGKKKLDVFQQSKYPIHTFLFNADLAAITALTEGDFSKDLRDGFVLHRIPLSRNAKLTTREDGVSWRITDGSQKYNIQNEEGWLKVFLDLESRWLLLGVNDSIKGWIQRERGTIFLPPEPILSSRQQLKVKLSAFLDGLKERVGISKQPYQVPNAELP